MVMGTSGAGHLYDLTFGYDCGGQLLTRETSSYLPSRYRNQCLYRNILHYYEDYDAVLHSRIHQSVKVDLVSPISASF